MSGPISVLFVGCSAPEEALHGQTAEFEISRAESAADALAAVEDATHDCLVSGYDIGETTGVDLLEAVREDHENLPFVLYAGAGDEAVASRAISAGVTDYVRAGEDAAGTLLARRIENAVEKYRTEQQVRRGYLALETAHEGISMLDADGRFTYVNEVYARNYGYEPEELVGEHWETLYPDGEETAIYEDVLPEVFEEGHWSGETTGLRADGSTFPEQHSLAATGDGGLICVTRDITDQQARTERLQAQQAALKRLYEVTASSEPFEQKLQDLFALGREQFDLDVAGFARVDPETDHFEVESVQGDHEYLQPGAQADLSETYCRLVAAEDESDPVSVRDPEASGLDDSVAYQTFGVRSYLGTDVVVDGSLYGTLFFASNEQRDEPFSEFERTSLHLMGEWLRSELERERRERRLAALNDVTRELMEPEDLDEVAGRLADAAPDALGLPVLAVALLDQESGDLRLAARTPEAAGLDLGAHCGMDGVGWDAFVDAEMRVDRGIADHEALVAVPLANRGVLLTAMERDPTGNEFAAEFVEAVGSTLSTALDRAERERLLHDRERTLQSQNEALERLNRINDIIRNIDQGLVSASSRDEIERLVCEQLAETGPYELAWIGEHDTVTDAVVPRTVAGNDKRYLEQVDITVADEPEGNGPTGKALKTLEPQVVDDALTDLPFEPWRQAALNRGYRSSIALPIEYDGRVYGVLNVYAGEPEAFDDLSRSVISELSETVAYAINAVESKRGLISSGSIELTFDLDRQCELVRSVAEFGAWAELQGLVSAPEGGVRAYFSVTDVDPDRLRERTASLPLSDASVTVRDGAEECLLEGILDADTFCQRVLDHGAVVHELVAGPASAEATVSIPATSNVREFVETVERWYPDTRMTAKREHEQSLLTRQGLWTELLDRLTERQRVALETAYFSGYFETPRQCTGTEVADLLGVSQPTFNSHLRTAHRKLFDVLMADEGRLGQTVEAQSTTGGEVSGD